mgnify:FL=1
MQRRFRERNTMFSVTAAGEWGDHFLSAGVRATYGEAFAVGRLLVERQLYLLPIGTTPQKVLASVVDDVAGYLRARHVKRAYVQCVERWQAEARALYPEDAKRAALSAALDAARLATPKVVLRTPPATEKTVTASCTVPRDCASGREEVEVCERVWLW